MATIIREVKEGKLHQGEDEFIAYQITTTPWASTPVVTGVKCYDVTAGGTRNDVSPTTLSGTSSTLGDVITLPLLGQLTAGRLYRVEVTFTSGGNTFELFFYVIGEH